jgi:hypothetical protein
MQFRTIFVKTKQKNRVIRRPKAPVASFLFKCSAEWGPRLVQGGVNMKRIPLRYKFLGLQTRYGATFGRCGAGWWRRGP